VPVFPLAPLFRGAPRRGGLLTEKEHMTMDRTPRASTLPAPLPGRRTRERSTKDLISFAEEHAATLRQRAGIGSRDRFDPRSLTRELGLVITYPADIPGLTPDDYALVTGVDVRTWSGMGGTLPDGRLLVVLHPSQTAERANVTIMEEVAHAHLGHRPSLLVTQPSGLEKRQYNQTDEDEAYWTAAAALLPRLIVAEAVWRGRSVEDLAAAYGASVECGQFRIKTLNLWADHRNRGARQQVVSL